MSRIGRKRKEFWKGGQFVQKRGGPFQGGKEGDWELAYFILKKRKGGTGLLITNIIGPYPEKNAI